MEAEGQEVRKFGRKTSTQKELEVLIEGRKEGEEQGGKEGRRDSEGGREGPEVIREVIS